MTVEETAPLEGFPWVKPSDFIKTMYRMNDLHHFLGGHSLSEATPILRTFWERYRSIHPRHQLWSQVDKGEKDITKCIPLYLHGDEGTSFKRGGILFLSLQGAIGYGTSKRAQELEEKLRSMNDGIPLNLLKTGLQTRVMICNCPKDSVDGYAMQKIYHICHVRNTVWNSLTHAPTCGPLGLQTAVHAINYISSYCGPCYIYTTHQKSICPAQDMYSDDRRVWNRIFQMVSEDLAVCEAGLQIGGEVIFPIILGNKGDWSYLVSWWFEVWRFLFIGIVFHKRWYIRIYPWLLHLWENSPWLNFKFIPTLAAHRFPVQTLTVPTEELQEVLEKRTTTLKGLGFATCVYVVKVLTGKICAFICAINMFYMFFYVIMSMQYPCKTQCVYIRGRKHNRPMHQVYTLNGRFKKT